jgi:transposase, IS605 OrfB family, central region
MGLSMGYDKCLVAAFSDDDDVYTIGDNLQEGIVEKRIAIQEYNQKLQKALRDSKGGHGRRRKLRSFDQQGSYEKNFIKHYNHLLSKAVVDFAKRHKAECIVIEDIDKSDLDNHPILLRNWTFYQLNTFIDYKAKREGITVETSKSKDKPRMCCCRCGCKLDKDNIIPKEIEWCHDISFTCPDCNQQIEYSYNKAKNISVMG